MLDAAVADEASDMAAPAAQGSAYDELATNIAARGGSAMSLDELNQRRREYIDATKEWKRADGTVVPEVYTKLRNLTKTYSFGIGYETTDECFDFFIDNFNEDEAQAYLEMPMGVLFTAAEFAQEFGREEADCSSLCEDLARRGLLWRTVRTGVAQYHHLPIMHGIVEYNLDRYSDSEWFGKFATVRTTGYENDMMNSGTPFYRAIPVNADVVGDEKILPLDDWKAIIDRNEVIGVSPCQCRRPAMLMSGMDAPDVGDPELVDFIDTVCGHPLETCISTGEEAQYYISKGIARQIDQDEAKKIIQRSVDAGMVVQSMCTRDSEIICSCHSDCCAVLSTYKAMGADFCATASCYPQVSDYTLVYDADACIKCGACAERCPMVAITMDGEDGCPQVDASCVRCGQCATVCPAGARSLVAKPVEERGYIPKSTLDDYNTLAAYRFEHGMIVQ